MKRLFILPTETIYRQHPGWDEILRRFEWIWGDLVCDIVTPLLDELSRHGVGSLADSDPLDVGYVSEIAYDIVRDLLGGDDLRPEDPFPPEPFREDFAPMLAEVGVITRKFLAEVQKYAKLALEKPVENHYPSAIMYERMVGFDLTLAIIYTPKPFLDRKQGS